MHGGWPVFEFAKLPHHLPDKLNRNNPQRNQRVEFGMIGGHDFPAKHLRERDSKAVR